MEEKSYYTKIIFETWMPWGRMYTTMINIPAKEYSCEVWTYQGGKEKVLGNLAKKLTDGDIQGLLPYINALNFEPYRDREDRMDDPGFEGYRDEYSVHFTGITNSHLPIYRHWMNYFYDEEHTRPYEKLYQYVNKNFK